MNKQRLVTTFAISAICVLLIVAARLASDSVPPLPPDITASKYGSHHSNEGEVLMPAIEDSERAAHSIPSEGAVSALSDEDAARVTGNNPQSFFADLKVGNKTTVADLEGLSLDFEESLEACQRLRRAANDYSENILNEEPWLANVALDREAASTYCEQGGVLLIVTNPGDRKKKIYIPCPPEHASPMAELQLAYQVVARSPRYLQGIKSRVLTATPKGITSTTLVPGSTIGCLVLIDGEGKSILEYRDNVPGVVHAAKN